MEFVFDLQIKNGVGTPLHAAASKGDFTAVKRLVNASVNVDNVSNLGVSPLQIAVHKGYIEIVQYLLDNGADVNLKDVSNFSSGRRPLHFAIATRNERMVDLLLKYKPRLETRDSANKTPLYMAVQNSCRNIIEALIKSGASINTPICHKCTRLGHVSPLGLAVVNGDMEVLNILVLNGGDVNARCDEDSWKGFTLLHLAAKLGHGEICKFLIQHGAGVDERDFHGKAPICHAIEGGCSKVYALILSEGGKMADASEMVPYAAESGSTEIMADLLARGADINALDQFGRSALQIAIRHGHVGLSKFLLDNRVDYDRGDKYGVKPIHEASKLGISEIVGLLLDLGVDPNSSGREIGRVRYTPLHYAAHSGDHATAGLLLNGRAEVDVTNGYGETPVCIAARNDSLGIAHLLLDRKADVNLTGRAKDCVHPLYCAVKGNLKEMVKLLLSGGALVNAALKNGDTVLHVAVKRGYEKVVDVLLQHGAAVNFDDNRRTPLFTAVLKRDRKITEMLLKYGASVNARDERSGETLLHVAARRGRVCIVEEILKHGAGLNETDKHGATALHIAAEKNQKLIAKHLLDYGIDTEITDDEGATALDYVDMERMFFGTEDSISSLIRKHIVKLKGANIDETDKHVQMIKGDVLLSGFLEKCEAEVLLMKSEKLNSYVSYYDILTKPQKRVVAYLKNEKIYEAVNLLEVPAKFPIYSSILECKYRRAKYAKKLLEKGMDCLDVLTRNTLPHEITAEILTYLDVNEMRYFCRVME